MKSELQRWAVDFPDAVKLGDTAFKGSTVAKFVRDVLPTAVIALLPEATNFLVEGSPGQGGWTHTSWLALCDPAVTSTVQDGFFVVYLLSADGSRIYLSLNQGCKVLKNAVGIAGARGELYRRAELMRARIGTRSSRFTVTGCDLKSSLWRAALYSAGEILSVEYDAKTIPDDKQLNADLSEALSLYQKLRSEGGWTADDEIILDAKADGLEVTLEQAKQYRQHKSIERNPSHSKTVKKILGTRCMGCQLEMADTYGTIAKGLIHAHHLTPLFQLKLGVTVKLNPRTDFAVLCPNCHSVIHRMNDLSDIKGLRKIIEDAKTSPRSGR